jgi:hypothetical protein
MDPYECGNTSCYRHQARAASIIASLRIHLLQMVELMEAQESVVLSDEGIPTNPKFLTANARHVLRCAK